jgi:hypothetical protein
MQRNRVFSYGFNHPERHPPQLPAEPEPADAPDEYQLVVPGEPTADDEADELAEMSDQDFMAKLRADIAKFKTERQPPVELPPWERRSHVTPKPRRRSRLAVSLSWGSDPRLRRASGN